MENKINQLINKMTLREKLGQLTQCATSNENIDQLEELAKKGELGSCILAYSALAGTDEQQEIFTDGINRIQKAAVEKSRLGIPVINGRDIIHGSRTIFPVPLAQAATWDSELIKDATAIMSKEASYDGVHWTFTPMIDICADPRWGRIIECPGEDPLLGRMFARATVEGVQGKDMSQKGKLAACAKHYIGYGASSGGRDKDSTCWSEYTLRNMALPAFKEAVDSGIATVMSAFNEIDGQPASSSKYHITDILKEELGFSGFVVSDWDAVKRLECQGVSDNDLTSAVLAINAGVDMDMVDQLYIKNLEEAVDKNLVSMETIDEAVRRVLRIKFKVGLFDNPYIDSCDKKTEIMTKEYLEKAKEVSLNSMVLLKNDGILPIKKGEKVTVTGPSAKDRENLLGSWHAGGKSEEVISIYEGFEMVNGEENVTEELTENICVLVLGEIWNTTGEGTTRPELELTDKEIALAKELKENGKKVVVILATGRPLVITKILPFADAVLQAWHGGNMCGLAAAEIVFGDFNPCGKLPVTMPRYTGQIPIRYNHQKHELGINWYYENQPYVATNDDSTPAFVFGHGLSYTDFKYDNFKYEFIDKEECVKITFDIENIGNYHGSEIAQCYINDIVASVTRPVKELKAFKKVYIKKGEKAEVEFKLFKEDLSFYDARGNFVFEEGNFKIEVGKSCKDIVFETTEYIKF